MKSIYIDLVRPDSLVPMAGMFIQCVGQRGRLNSRYVILSAYRVKRKDPKAYPRYQMKVDNVASIPRTAPVIMLRWYQRKKYQKNRFEI